MLGVKIDGLEGLSMMDQRIGQLADFQLKSLLEGIGGIVEASTKERIGVTKMDPDGIPWAAWSPKYADRQKQTKPAATLLNRQGDLNDSIQWEVSKDGVEIGSPLVYALTHQMGDDTRHIPARPYLGLSMTDVDAIKDFTVEFLSEELR